MMCNVLFVDEVSLDIRATKEWYKKQNSGLEKRFALEVKKAISRLQKDPKIYELKYKTYVQFLQPFFHTPFISLLMMKLIRL